jgi:predicted nucleic acid-binding protein
MLELIGGILPVSSLLVLEFRQSVRLQTHLYGLDRKKGFPPAEGTRMLRDLQSDLVAGVLSMKAIDWADVHRIAEQLSDRHTREGGHHLADLLHVATALHLGAESFLTFDAQQRKLAAAEGMEVPV